MVIHVSDVMTQNPNGSEGFRNTKACLKISCIFFFYP